MLLIDIIFIILQESKYLFARSYLYHGTATKHTSYHQHSADPNHN